MQTVNKASAPDYEKYKSNHNYGVGKPKYGVNQTDFEENFGKEIDKFKGDFEGLAQYLSSQAGEAGRATALFFDGNVDSRRNNKLDPEELKKYYDNKYYVNTTVLHGDPKDFWDKVFKKDLADFVFAQGEDLFGRGRYYESGQGMNETEFKKAFN